MGRAELARRVADLDGAVPAEMSEVTLRTYLRSLLGIGLLGRGA